MTPRQLVLLDLHEVRRHRGFEDHVLAMSKHPAVTLCDQIAESVGRSRRGWDQDELVRRTRAVQRERLLLACLALGCNEHLARSEDERRLSIAFLLAHLNLLVAWSELGQQPVGMDATAWLEIVKCLRHRLIVTRDAIRLIQQEYFDGATLTYAGIRDQLERDILDTDRLLSLGEGFLRETDATERGPRRRKRSKQSPSGPMPGDDAKVQTSARALAGDWVTFARAQTLARMDETRRGMKLVSDMLQRRDAEDHAAEEAPALEDARGPAPSPTAAANQRRTCLTR